MSKTSQDDKVLWTLTWQNIKADHSYIKHFQYAILIHGALVILDNSFEQEAGYFSLLKFLNFSAYRLNTDIRSSLSVPTQCSISSNLNWQKRRMTDRESRTQPTTPVRDWRLWHVTSCHLVVASLGFGRFAANELFNYLTTAAAAAIFKISTKLAN